MAASSRSGVSRKIWVLAAAIILAIAVYTAGWFYAASLLKAKTLALLGQQHRSGVTAECSDADYRGYPFRIGLFCSRVAIDDRENGIAVTFGALRSAAQVYEPNRIVWELDGPAEARTSQGLATSSQWQALQSSLLTNARGVDRSSTVIEGLKTSIVSSQTQQNFDISVGHTEAHLRQNGENLDAALTLTDTDIVSKGMPQLMPRFTTTANITLAGKAAMLEGMDGANGLRGSQGEMRRVAIDLGNGQVLSITGPFSVDEEGRVSGRLKIQVEKINAWREQLKAAMPEAASTIDTASKMLSALTGGGDNASLDVTLNRGKILIGGFIAVGEIPPLL